MKKIDFLSELLEQLEAEVEHIQNKQIRLDGEREFVERYISNIKDEIENMGEADTRISMHVPQIVFSNAKDAQKFLNALKDGWKLDNKLSVKFFEEISNEFEPLMDHKPYFMQDHPSAHKIGWLTLKDAFVSKQRRSIWDQQNKKVVQQIRFVIDMPEVAKFDEPKKAVLTFTE